MKTIVLLVIVSLVGACVASPEEPTSESTVQALCTQEDQDAGLCDGPAGGWAALASLTQSWAQQAASSLGSPGTVPQASCGQLPSSQQYCSIEVHAWTGGYLSVTCSYDPSCNASSCTSFWCARQSNGSYDCESL